MTFIDLRDRYGITQVTVDPAKIDIVLPEIKSEYVLQISVFIQELNVINGGRLYQLVFVNQDRVDVQVGNGDLFGFLSLGLEIGRAHV